MVVHACDPNPQKEREGQKFKATLPYKVFEARLQEIPTFFPVKKEYGYRPQF